MAYRANVKVDREVLDGLDLAIVLAQQIPTHFHPASVLDIGCGTGDAVIEDFKVLESSATLQHIAFADGNYLKKSPSSYYLARESNASSRHFIPIGGHFWLDFGH